MQQVIPMVPSTADAQLAEPIPLEVSDLHKVVGGAGQPASPSVVVVIDPDW